MTEWHIITAEYPPQVGGVSDHTQMMARGLAAAGDCVHVWCRSAVRPGCGRGRVKSQPEDEPTATGVSVHRELGRLAPADFRRAGRLLNHFEGPTRLLVQWVPHAYGYRAMNLQ